MSRHLLSLLVLLIVPAFSMADDPRPIRVVVWDERQPEQKEAYDGGFLGDHLAKELAKRTGFDVKSVGLDDPNWGLPEELLDDTDVLIWWSHVRDGDFDRVKARSIVKRVKEGKLALVVMHSGLSSLPLKEAMYEVVQKRATDALGELAKQDKSEQREFAIEFQYPGKDYEVDKDKPYEPGYVFSALGPVNYGTSVKLPACMIRSWREDGKPSHVAVKTPDHPIMAGLPKQFDFPQTEMYDEPFQVPEPDVVLFEERWDAGEHFRGGCLWRVGKGDVFYFRPGHETYPVFKDENVLKILDNATRWLGQRVHEQSSNAKQTKAN